MEAPVGVFVFMARRLRCIPQDGSLVEVTSRTLHGRLLLRPGLELNDIIAGALGRAQRRYEVNIVSYVFLSNHYHLLVRVRDARQLAGFVGYLNSKVAREVSRLTGWSGKIWERRYQAILVSDEELAQIERFRYVLSHGCKENLVARLRDWPGVHCVRALLEGEPLSGHWFDRTSEYAARQRGEDPENLRYATAESVTLSPLPCWEGLSPEAYRRRVVNLVETIEEDAAAETKRSGVGPLGPARILAQHPQHRPEQVKKSPAPLLHAASREVRRRFYEAYALFVAAYRGAAELLRAGDSAPPFPVGCFPPALPFVAR
jgi:hypothetical protein